MSFKPAISVPDLWRITILRSAAYPRLEVCIRHGSSASGAVCSSLHSFGHSEALGRSTWFWAILGLPILSLDQVPIYNELKRGGGGERRKGKNWERKRKEERESAASFTPHKCSQLWRNWLKTRRGRVRKTVKGSVKRERELREWKLDWEGKRASLQDWSIMTSQEN